MNHMANCARILGTLLIAVAPSSGLAFNEPTHFIINQEAAVSSQAD